MSYISQFEFPSRQDLVETLFASPLAHSALKIGGNSYRGDGKIPSGYVNEASLHAFAHEAGHMLDFFLREKAHRIEQSGFGFHYPQEWIYNRFCAMPTNTRAVHAECRATAIQLCLIKDVMGWEVSAHDFLVDMANTIGTSVSQLEDAYLIPRRRAESRRLNAENRRAMNERDTMRKQPDRKAAAEFMKRSSALNSASCKAYRQDRLEYVLKHCVKHYERLSPGHLLAVWHDMLEWIANNIKEGSKSDQAAA